MVRRFSFWHRCPSGADLSAYGDGELSAPKRERVASHLKECARCRREVEALTAFSRDVTTAFREAAQAVERPVAQPGSWVNSPSSSPPSRRLQGQLLRRVAALAAAACLLVVAVCLLWPSPEVTEPEQATVRPQPPETPAEASVTADEAEPRSVSVVGWRPLRADVCALAAAGDIEARAQMKLMGLDGRLLAQAPEQSSESLASVPLSDVFLEQEIQALWNWRFTGERL